MTFTRLPSLIAILFLVGCASGSSSGGSLFQSKAEKNLAVGIHQYDEGNYVEAVANLQDALTQGLDKQDEVRARKYLAFTHCVSGKQKACADEFRKALAIDPALELAPSEAGHPIWGPVFKSVKAKAGAAKK
mgnify:CR=1 FL=1|jgi:Tfp pilus assembly protein PilF